MKHILTRIPHVLVVQETSMKAGRDKVAGIFRYAHLYGPWHLHVVQGRIGENRPLLLRDWGSYDGFIFGQMSAEIPSARTLRGRPVVLLDPLPEMTWQTSPFARASLTLDDSEQVGRTGAEFFLDQGWRTFAYVGEQLNRAWSIRRGQGFRKRIEDAGWPCHVYSPSIEKGDWNQEEERLSRWLQALPKPTALLAAMDPRAQQVINLCLDVGIRVPDELAVMGIDDDELFCDGTVPTLTSIRRDTEACGFQAARMLDRLMRKKHRGREVFSYGATGVSVRDSTRRRPSTGGDATALRARDFIRINASAAIGVPEIVRHLQVSRRQIETRFRETFGQSLLDEIQAVRMTLAEKLLRETELPVKDVFKACGNQTPQHFRRLFKARHGVTMLQYRKGGRLRGAARS